METAIGCHADLLEAVNADLDQLSKDIFQLHRGRVEKSLQTVINRLRPQANVNSRVRESLVDKYRLLNFADHQAASWAAAGARQRLNTTLHDARALSEHVSFMEDKIAFLLDATLGTISRSNEPGVRLLFGDLHAPPTLMPTSTA